MNFSKYVEKGGKILVLNSTSINISELVGFLQSNAYVTELYLRNNGINDEDAKALASLTNLTKLHLDCSNVGGEGAKALASLKRLTELCIYHSKIDDEGAKALSNLKNLTKLDLGWNSIGDEGAKAFASEFKSELDQANFETKLKIILFLMRGIKIDHDDMHIVFRFQELALETQKKCSTL
ncbi:leucine-rich repeat domain-containing protein [Wolbachia endosymbiont of Ctenocephalides felis wCfeJ]|uniref:hypothetical protein n=1 Tax=Wolbachia endosymbiont of Ctenocephalides felis wCfeJ TaxID=2732594 RepID=UPI001446CAFF|nr:hypothetical protein [Wolbachia endosymbiont of Ctenocephalides felis wCfeJ]WCR57687.1 MAG: hypothetical protein PG980_000159 [Wolbachia endosymbiont of Ctenocephalides felis wCfeJ]